MASEIEVRKELDELKKLVEVPDRAYIELGLLSNDELESMSVREAADMCLDLARDFTEDKEIT